jgi:hypothetical protein
MGKTIDNKKISKNYTKINNDIIRDSSMTIDERFVLIYLLHLPGDWSINMASMPKSIGGIGRDAFRNAYNGLIKLGYAKTTKYKDDKGQWVYKQEVSSEPSYLKPVTENQALETSDWEPGGGNQVLETRAFTKPLLSNHYTPITKELIKETTNDFRNNVLDTVEGVLNWCSTNNVSFGTSNPQYLVEDKWYQKKSYQEKELYLQTLTQQLQTN